MILIFQSALQMTHGATKYENLQYFMIHLYSDLNLNSPFYSNQIWSILKG